MRCLDKIAGSFTLIAFSSLTWQSVASAAPRGPDFDNDNIDDLVIGVPGEDISTATDAGVVHVLYGSGSGLTDPVNRVTTFHRDITGFPGSVTTNERLGLSLAWGDFNGDCYDDLSIGTSLGEVHIFSGGPNGLNTTDYTVLSVSLGTAASQAAGDVNGDGYDDLIVGSPDDERVVALYGSATGLDEPYHHTEQSNGADQTQYGHAIAVGDFNCDGFEDLAVGAPGWDVSFNGGTEINAGVVHVTYGQAPDLDSPEHEFFDQGMANIEDDPEDYDAFGFSLAVGNFNSDYDSSTDANGCKDLAIGVPGESIDGLSNAGAVAVLYGTDAWKGLQVTSPADQLWHQDVTGMEGGAAASSFFGWSLVTGRMDTGVYDDLAIGVPGRAVGGAVSVVRGSSTGLNVAWDMLWSQNSSNVGESSESGDNFGVCLSFGQNWRDDGKPSLAVCVPDEETSTPANSGLMNLLYLESNWFPTLTAGLNATVQQSDFTSGVLEANDKFASTTIASRDRPFVDSLCD